MSLDTLANVKARLGISGSADDALLQLLMDSADDWVAMHTGRDFAGGTFTEYFDGDGDMLALRNFPINDVTSVKVDPSGTFGADTLISPTSYAVIWLFGLIQAKSGPIGPPGSQLVQVVYTTPTGAVPNDVKRAYARLVGRWYAELKTEIATGYQIVAEQKFGDVSAAYTSVDLAVPREVERLLAPYRTPTI